ncbi:MAG: hypothetical protein QM487_00740 [Candidatus Marithrix sp.]
MLFSEKQIERVRDEIDNCLDSKNPFEKLVEILEPFGVNGVFIGYANFQPPFKNDNLTLKEASKKNFAQLKKQPIIIKEARGGYIGSKFGKDETSHYLNNILPYDYASIKKAYSVTKDTSLFIAHENELILGSKAYKHFYAPNQVKDFFTFIMPLDTKRELVAWFTLEKFKDFFSAKESMQLITLFKTYGLGRIIKRALLQGSEINFLGSGFTPKEWELLTYLAKCNNIPKKINVAKYFNRSSRAIEVRLLKILENGLPTPEKTGLMRTVHTLVYNKPMINWFDTHVIRPEGDTFFINN